MTIQEQLQSLFPTLNDIPSEYRLNPVEQSLYLVAGELKAWEGPFQEVLSPVCFKDAEGLKQARVGRFPLLGRKEALEILDAAVKAYDNGRGGWPTISVESRINCVRDFVEKMREQRGRIINLLMWEIGKNLADSTKEFDRTIEYVEKTILALKDLDRASSRLVFEEGIFGQIRRSPFGVVLCMGPYNYPLNETFTTLIPALIMGNTVVFKPAKLGVLLFEPLLEAFRGAFPPGVVNTVYGDGPEVIGPIMESGLVDVLAFIGSYRTSNILEKQHPKPNRLHTVLGLSAKNPAIILADTDLDATVKEAVLGALSFNGQRCTALKILFVHRSIAQEFVDKLATAVSALKPGVPWASGVQLTPLPEPGKPDKLLALLKDATDKGACVINDGGGQNVETFFFPAVLYPVDSSMRIYHEEQFGPLVPVVPFDDIKTPIDYITQSIYGQQVSLFGKDPDLMSQLIDPLVNQVSRVNINSQCQRGPDSFPFTGRKDSAEGTLSISDALRVFSIRTLVAAKETEQNKALMQTILRERKSNFLNTDYIF